MANKKGFTLEQHSEAGKLMKQSYENVLHLEVIFGNAYGKTKEPCLSLKKAVSDLLKAKDKADDLFCGENPAPDRSPYFGVIDKPQKTKKL